MDWSGQPAWSTSVVNDWGRDCIEQTTLYRTLRRRGQPAWLTSVANDWGRGCIEQTALLRTLPRPPRWSTTEAEIVLSRLSCFFRSPGMVSDRGRDCIEQIAHKSGGWDERARQESWQEGGMG